MPIMLVGLLSIECNNPLDMSTVLNPHMYEGSSLTHAMERSDQSSSPVGFFHRLIYIQVVLKYSVCTCVVWYPEGVSHTWCISAVLCALGMYYTSYIFMHDTTCVIKCVCVCDTNKCAEIYTIYTCPSQQLKQSPPNHGARVVVTYSLLAN